MKIIIFAFSLFVSFGLMAETIPSIQANEPMVQSGWADQSGNHQDSTPQGVCQKMVPYVSSGFYMPKVDYVQASGANYLCSIIGFYPDGVTPLNRVNLAIYPHMICLKGQFDGTTNMCRGAACPDSSYTLSADKATCSRADCLAKQQQNAAGTGCECNLNSLNNMAGERPWFEGDGASVPSSICDGGCLRGFGFGLGGGKKWAAQGGAFTGATCTPGDKPPVEKPPVPDKKPPCSATEGVMTSSSGTVACVPEGIADPRKPVIKKEEKNEKFPDGSEKNTETTKTKDPATGAEHTETKTTNTPKPDGTQGQAGPVGTGVSSGGTSGSGGGGGSDCKGDKCGDQTCDPTLYFCGGPDTDGLYQKKDKKIEAPLQAFAAGVRNSLLGTDSSAFFNVTIPPGSCPSWGVEIPYLKTRVDISQYMCDPRFISAFDLIGSVLLVMAAFAAYRWALL